MSVDEPVALSDDQLEKLAELLALKLAQVKPATAPMLTVEDVSTTFQVSRAWVYENAGRLGGVKLGPGQRAPLRFNAERVAAALNPLTSSEPVTTPTPSTKPGRKRPKHLLPVYDG